jgi:hypothetical protein
MNRIRLALPVALMLCSLFPMKSLATSTESHGLQFLPF